MAQLARKAPLRRTIRQRLEAAIERAIAYLDQLDGDDGLELECEDEGAQCDDEGVSGYDDPDCEPSLAALAVFDQRLWSNHLDPARTHLLDGEDDDEGEDDHRTREDVIKAQRRAYPNWQNVGEFIPVRAL